MITITELQALADVRATEIAGLKARNTKLMDALNQVCGCWETATYSSDDESAINDAFDIAMHALGRNAK
jgi:hypothetical protein